MADGEPVVSLTVDHVAKAFGGIKVLRDVSFVVDAGTCCGLIGPNGSGKSTMRNIVCGQLAADSGEVWLGTERIDRLPSHARAIHGIGQTFQTVRLFDNLSVVENVMVGCHLNGRAGVLRALGRRGFVRAEERRLRTQAEESLDVVGVPAGLLGRPAGALSVAHQRMVELARALVARPRVLLLDEPTSGLDPDQVLGWTTVLSRLQRKLAITVLLIEHRMDVIARMTHRVLALHDGYIIASGSHEEVLGDEQVRQIYLGTR
jgi:ABC-type branched-subunit amino acid transport system ATPase component